MNLFGHSLPVPSICHFHAGFLPCLDLDFLLFWLYLLPGITNMPIRGRTLHSADILFSAQAFAGPLLCPVRGVGTGGRLQTHRHLVLKLLRCGVVEGSLPPGALHSDGGR